MGPYRTTEAKERTWATSWRGKLRCWWRGYHRWVELQRRPVRAVLNSFQGTKYESIIETYDVRCASCGKELYGIPDFAMRSLYLGFDWPRQGWPPYAGWPYDAVSRRPNIGPGLGDT